VNLVVIAASGGPFPWLKPVGDVLRFPFDVSLGFFYNVLSHVPVISAIGAYGLAIVLVTVGVKLILFPLYQTQLRLSRKTQDEQRKIAPQLAALRKKYKGKTTSQEFISAQQELYKEHGINPAAPLLGCLPTLAQFPVLIGLYQAIFQHHFLPHGAKIFFLGLNLGIHASVQNPVTWILPVLAGATTYVQSKMFTPPPPPPGEQDSQAAQMQQMTQSMSLIMPVMIVFFGFQSYALQGLVLYWIVSNLFSIGQQYTVNGWGQLPILGKPAGAPPPGGSAGAGSNGTGRGDEVATTVARVKQPAGARRRGRRR